MATAGREIDVLDDLDRLRTARRGRSVTPSLNSLWEENRRLFMENLRLWDCLTLVRSDPAMNCQRAISLVFGLEDSSYLRTFPDTNQLLQLIFPSGVIYYKNNEEARVENYRLQNENYRLHAAVWVLRDNPSLQADSTVAAIFRLNEAQFLSKFKSVVACHGTPVDVPGDQPQNNNKERRRGSRTTLDLAGRSNMSINLNHLPVQLGSTTNTNILRRKPSKRHRSSTNHQQDFTSNWKPTSPVEQDLAAQREGDLQADSPGRTDEGPGLDCAILCWRQNGSCYRPVDLYALEEAASQSQSDISSVDGARRRERRRSYTVSRADNLASERLSKCPSVASPGKFVSLAQPPPRSDCLVNSKPTCLKDKDKVALDTSHNHSAMTRPDLSPLYRPVVASHALELVTERNSTTANLPANCLAAAGTHRVTSHTQIASDLREPCKRYQRDTATSPMLDARTCVILLDHAHLKADAEDLLANGHCWLKQSCSMNDQRERKTHISNVQNDTNNNNDNEAKKPADPGAGRAPVVACTSSAQSGHVRPMSPKGRNMLQARLKNKLACDRLKLAQKLDYHKGNNCQHKSTEAAEPLVTNNSNVKNRRGTMFSYPNESDVEEDNENKDEDEKRDEQADNSFTEETPDVEVVDFDRSGLEWYVTYLDQAEAPPQDAQEDTVGIILYSDEPAPRRIKKNLAYPHQSYVSVKQFLDRHRRLMQHLDRPSKIDLFSREITPSMALLNTRAAAGCPKEDRKDWSNFECGHPVHSGSARNGKGTAQSEFSLQPEYRVKDPGLRAPDLAAGRRDEGSKSLPIVRPLLIPRERGSDQLFSLKDKLDVLKKLGKFKYTKPLATMIKRNGKLQWRAPQHDENRAVHTMEIMCVPGAKPQLWPVGPFISFGPVD